LFCIELLVLHNNQQAFWSQTEDEIRQILVEFGELALNGELVVEQGKQTIVIKQQADHLIFE
jgi:hypothetical protein